LWPVNIVGPNEGSLDRDQFVRLIDHLAEESPDGNATTCFSYYAPFALGEYGDDRAVYRGGLWELAAFYESDELAGSGSPSNLWASDRSWFVYTDWDLWATKVSGSQSLITRLLHDDLLEAVTLDF